MSQTNRSNGFNIAVITVPYKSIGVKAILENFIDLLEPISNELFAITGDFPGSLNGKIHLMKIKGDDKKEFILIRLLKYILTELRVTFNLIKILKNVDIVSFQIGAQGYLLPKIVAKLFRKRVVIFLFGSPWKIAEIAHGESLLGMGRIVLPRLEKARMRINFFFTDLIAVESKSVVDFIGITKYKNKICTSGAGAIYVDTNVFTVEKELKERKNIVGYIGRLSEEKGVMNFFSAIPLISEKHKALEFLIGGSGPLIEEIIEKSKNNKLYGKVELTGWIPHEKIPDYLNELRLIVLPSYVEGVPGIVQEAMACGTPVLATPVGGIPDLIRDGETGFIMENNLPEYIAKNVVRALEHPNLEEIVKSARKLIEDEYAYKPMVKKCGNLLDDLMKVKKNSDDNEYVT